MYVGQRAADNSNSVKTEEVKTPSRKENINEESTNIVVEEGEEDSYPQHEPVYQPEDPGQGDFEPNYHPDNEPGRRLFD